jgi:hypothetical protein
MRDRYLLAEENARLRELLRRCLPYCQSDFHDMLSRGGYSSCTGNLIDEIQEVLEKDVVVSVQDALAYWCTLISLGAAFGFLVFGTAWLCVGILSGWILVGAGVFLVCLNGLVCWIDGRIRDKMLGR